MHLASVVPLEEVSGDGVQVALLVGGAFEEVAGQRVDVSSVDDMLLVLGHRPLLVMLTRGRVIALIAAATASMFKADTLTANQETTARYQ